MKIYYIKNNNMNNKTFLANCVNDNDNDNEYYFI